MIHGKRHTKDKWICMLGHDAKNFNVSRTGYFLYCDDRFGGHNFKSKRCFNDI